MDERLQRETRDLVASWSKHDRATLRDYLVADVEDPRINVQSMLTRHYLVAQLFPGKFTQLMQHELRFSNVMNWGLTLQKQAVQPQMLHALHNALLMEQDEFEGVKVPAFVSEAFAQLPAEVEGAIVGDYISDLLLAPPGDASEASLSEHVTRTFATLWSAVLAQQEGMAISVLEAACGSANDYRFLNAFGLSRFLNYAGFDLSEKNIQNARQMFPDIRFDTGNALAIDAPDKSFDYVIAHDLFEHLSVNAMQVAIGEVCRVATRGLCIGFFNLHEGDEHHIKKVENYHWNKVSIPLLHVLFAQHGGTVRFIHIDTLLRETFGYTQTHNKGAYTAIVNFTQE